MRSHRHLIAALGATLGAALVLASPPASAETRREYVNEYVLIIDWVTRADSWVTAHLEDTSLCRTAHSIAERHVELARRLTPPQEFAPIHPHFLLVVENAERMLHHAASGNRIAFHRQRRHVHEELRIISELLQANGHFMPVINP